MDKYLRANRDMWNRLAPLHAASDFYENEAFLEGQCTLDPIEIAEIGPVKGKSLLHLQCHFGQDTMSWARRGAKVTGVDFSGEAIKIAKALSRKINVPAKFVCADLHSLPQKLSGKFDIVFTSGGVLTWLPELDSWEKSSGAISNRAAFSTSANFILLPILSTIASMSPARKSASHISIPENHYSSKTVAVTPTVRLTTNRPVMNGRTAWRKYSALFSTPD